MIKSRNVPSTQSSDTRFPVSNNLSRRFKKGGDRRIEDNARRLLFSGLIPNYRTQKWATAATLHLHSLQSSSSSESQEIATENRPKSASRICETLKRFIVNYKSVPHKKRNLTMDLDVSTLSIIPRGFCHSKTKIIYFADEIKPGQHFSCCLGHVVGPEKFYLLPEENDPDLEFFDEILQSPSALKPLGSDKIPDPNVNLLVPGLPVMVTNTKKQVFTTALTALGLVKEERDVESWYRGVILRKVSADENLFEVFTIDLGETLQLPSSQIRYMRQDILAHKPAQAILVQMKGYENSPVPENNKERMTRDVDKQSFVELASRLNAFPLCAKFVNRVNVTEMTHNNINNAYENGHASPLKRGPKPINEKNRGGFQKWSIYLGPAERNEFTVDHFRRLNFIDYI